MQPTVLENVSSSATVHCDEVFGPTVNLYPVDDMETAIGQANSLDFGLHAAVFTRELDTAFKFASGLECGGVMINDSTDYRLDTMPFGGVKNSGLGREGIRYAIEEMTEPKVVCWLLRT
jgi:glyceraldehyde-3-phosphate dehydrogenase (NADP+)